MTKLTPHEDYVLAGSEAVEADLAAARRDAGTTFAASPNRHVFGSARDAIDAVSAFEAASLADWEYEIRACDTQDDATGGWEVVGYLVALNRLTPPLRGFLAPMEA